ncbi:MAG: response regulator [Promethearchaeota archaeon]
MEQKNILILEDDENFIKLYKILFERDFINIYFANNEEEGLKYLKEKNINLIIADIALGEGMEGLKFMDKIKLNKRWKDIPAIAVTGYTLDQDIKRIKEAGFIECFTKPFELSKFKDVLKKYIPI